MKTVTFSEKLVPRNQVHNIYTWKNVPLTSTNFLEYTMIWSNFELPQSFIVENSKQCINFNTYVLHMWFFRKLIVIVVSSNKLRKNSPNDFHSIYCAKSGQMRSYFWSVFGHFSRIVFVVQKMLQLEFVKNS